MKKRHLLQLFISILLIITLSYIASLLFFRLDLTSEKRYTLSSSTKQLLEQLDEELTIRIYLDGDELPIGFKKMRKSLQEMLDEFDIYAGHNLYYEFVNPNENTDAVLRKNVYDDLEKKGLIPYNLQETDRTGKTSMITVFPGIEVTYKGYELSVNLLKNSPNVSAEDNLNNSIQALEYELTNAIRKLDSENVQRIALLEGHGELGDIFLQDITNILSEYYSVERGEMQGRMGVLDNFAAVIIAKPMEEFKEADKFVLDQYLMKGGKILWFADGAVASMDSLSKNPSTIALANSLNLEDMLFKYGVRINYDLIQDIQCAPIGMTMSASGTQPRIELFPWLYFPLLVTKNEHPVTKYINMIRTEFASSLDTLGADANIKKTVLLTSSRYAHTVSVPNRISLDMVGQTPDQKEFNQSNLPIAVLLEGEFESVFKNRQIPELVQYAYKDSLQYQSPATAKMIVVSDGDMIRNQVQWSGQAYPLGFDRHSQKVFQGNKEFILNAVNYLCDDAGLMQLRSRELKIRLLDKTKIQQQRTRWQLINLLIPMLLVLAFALLMSIVRGEVRMFDRKKK